jgi:uncharacterized protein
MTEVLHLLDLEIGASIGGLALIGALMALGLFVGFLTGLFGVGGAFLITPILSVAFGVPYQVAIGSGLSYTIGASSSGMGRHVRIGNFEPRSMIILAATSMLAAVGGGYLNDFAHDSLGPHDYKLVMDALYVVMLGATVWMVGRNREAHRSGRSLLQRVKLPPYINLPAAGLDRVSLTGICLVGLFIGLMKGMMGIGGGVLFMPLLILVVGLTAHQAVGTSLGVVVFSSIAGSLKYGMSGFVNLWIVMALLVSSVFGIQIGAWVCLRLHATRLRQWFAVLVGIVAIIIAIRFVTGIFRGPEVLTTAPSPQ